MSSLFPARPVPRPLFDRLEDHEPDQKREPRPLSTLDRKELLESVRQELERLLNTRASRLPHRPAGLPRTVIDYGLHDPTHWSPHDPDDRRRLAADIAEAVRAYEPRLSDVRVTVAPLPEQPEVLGATIEGRLVGDTVAEPVSFLTAFAHDLEGAQVHARS
ncbi:MAG TPA: type VI secretion system baseplate subunit TssE [Thermoanaerobaculia bacterium]|nr:type VI secretion system baseplate subunit TssE [Thermoanaerobaculia bacterium]